MIKNVVKIGFWIAVGIFLALAFSASAATIPVRLQLDDSVYLGDEAYAFDSGNDDGLFQWLGTGFDLSNEDLTVTTKIDEIAGTSAWLFDLVRCDGSPNEFDTDLYDCSSYTVLDTVTGAQAQNPSGNTWNITFEGVTVSSSQHLLFRFYGDSGVGTAWAGFYGSADEMPSGIDVVGNLYCRPQSSTCWDESGSFPSTFSHPDALSLYISVGVPSVDNFDMLLPTSTTTQDFASYVFTWDSDESIVGRIVVDLENISDAFEHQQQTTIPSGAFPAMEHGTSTVALTKIPTLEFGDSYTATSTLQFFAGSDFVDIASTSTTFTVSETGFILPDLEELSFDFEHGQEIGGIFSLLRTRAPFAYFYDVYDIYTELGSVTSDDFPDVDLDFGLATSTIFSQATLTEYYDSSLLSTFKELIKMSLWVGFLFYVYNRVRTLSFT